MFVAALGRFVLAIDCFATNLVRLRRAVVLINIVQLYIPFIQMESKVTSPYTMIVLK